MADQAAHVIRKTSPRGGRTSFVIADSVVVYAGMLVQLESGFANHWDETGSFLGIVLGGDDRALDGVLTGETSDTPPTECRVDVSGVTLTHLSIAGTATQAKVGNLVFCATSNVADMTLTDTTNPPVGWMSRYRSATDVDVTLFTPEEHMAGIADAAWNA